MKRLKQLVTTFFKKVAHFMTLTSIRSKIESFTQKLRRGFQLIIIVFQNFKSVKNSTANVVKINTDVVVTEVHTLPDGEEFRLSYYGDEGKFSNIYIGEHGFTHSHEKDDLLELSGLFS
jgi:hypothetical protein